VTSFRIPSLDGLRGLSILLVLVDYFAYGSGFPIHHLCLRMSMPIMECGYFSSYQVF
jgi:peptidoglycan/LPS O-acetylase OafA/YrhL